MTLTGSAAITKARSITTGYNGLCLAFVRTVFGVPAKYATARAAWDGATYKHKTSSPGSIPAGVPVFFQGLNPAGHVAISLGGGQCYTTDDTVGGPRELPIATIVQVGYALLGWTEDLNSVRVYAAKVYSDITGIQKAVRARADNVSGPDTRKRVSALQGAAHGRFPYGIAYAQSVVGTEVDGVWGHDSKTALAKTVKAIQKAVGLKGKDVDGVDGPVTDAAITKALKGAHQA